ncbi:hypothetical protein RclHR1_01490016 [Rhizophagus clarus]|uniref:Uncharacterized protein n=1 Tax=Rhizophagus clarus TaxID=94130 RepID=A0A2Z6QFM6_9GLOM|nr:hypothetical protein RclHR1_01490016 [Rhizophagus clarus]
MPRKCTDLKPIPFRVASNLVKNSLQNSVLIKASVYIKLQSSKESFDQYLLLIHLFFDFLFYNHLRYQ